MAVDIVATAREYWRTEAKVLFSDNLYDGDAIMQAFLAGVEKGKQFDKPKPKSLRELREAMPQKWGTDIVEDLFGITHGYLKLLESGVGDAPSRLVISRLSILYSVSESVVKKAIEVSSRNAI